MFPYWEEGLKKILQAVGVEEANQINSIIERQRVISTYASLFNKLDQQTEISPAITKTLTFKGEKQFFIGRQNYIDKLIKEKLSIPGSRVSIQWSRKIRQKSTCVQVYKRIH